MKMFQGKYSLFICWLFLAFVFLITIAGKKWEKGNVLKSDAAGYYAYLPAIFIYNDPFGCKFYPVIDSIYNPGNGVVYYAVQRNPETGRMYFKYNYGVALFEAPLFFIAHLYAKITGKYPANGYSAPYQLSVAITTVVIAFFSLLILRLFLLNYFTEIVTACTIAIIAFGTNFLAQVITQPGLSHIYLFFLFTLVLVVTKQLYEAQDWKYFVLLGAAIGWVIITRSSDIFICFFPLLWGAGGNLRVLKGALLNNSRKIFVSFFALLALIFVQLLYWKLATGHWYYYTYRNEYFDFGNWQIVNGLFSYRKGWFVYTPMALLGFLGCYFVWQKQKLRPYVLMLAIYFASVLYVVFCWWQWYYGGSFGCRPLVESIALLAIPIAALVEWLSSKTKLLVGGATAILFFILLNLFQTAQYAKGIIHWQKMNKEYYWRVFGKWNVTEDDKMLLNTTEELTTEKNHSR